MFEPSIVHLVAGSGQITFTYLSNKTDISENTTAQLMPSFTTDEVGFMARLLLYLKVIAL